MATIDSKEIVDDIIAGKYPEDGWVKIVQYNNMFGGVAYGCITVHDDPDKYRASEFVRNPVTIWNLNQGEST